MISTHQVRALTSRRFDSIITWFAFITSKKSPVYHHRSGNNRGFITNYLLSQKANITKGLHSHICLAVVLELQSIAADEDLCRSHKAAQGLLIVLQRAQIDA